MANFTSLDVTAAFLTDSRRLAKCQQLPVRYSRVFTATTTHTDFLHSQGSQRREQTGTSLAELLCVICLLVLIALTQHLAPISPPQNASTTVVPGSDERTCCAGFAQLYDAILSAPEICP